MIEKISHHIVMYAIAKGEVDEKDYDIYKYGFWIGIELCISIIVSVLCAISLDSLIELILFLSIFAPLRAFAGGIHLKTFKNCFLLSIGSLILILSIVKYCNLPVMLLNWGILCLLVLIIFVAYIKEKTVSEKRFFQSKLDITIISIACINILFNIYGINKLVFLIFLTLLLELFSISAENIMYNYNVRV